MAKVIISSFLLTSGHNRLDVESYSHNTRNENIIYVPFDEVIEFLTNGATPLHEDLSIGNVTFFTAENIMDMYIDDSKVKKIRYEFHNKQLQRSALKELDLLISIKGKIGTSAVVINANGFQNINQDVARIVLKKDHNPFVYSAYFATRYGKEAARKVCTGQINPFLGLGNLKKIQIPLFSSDLSIHIEDCIRKVFAKRCKSKNLYYKAEKILFDEINWNNDYESKPSFWIINDSNINEFKRLDPEFWKPTTITNKSNQRIKNIFKPKVTNFTIRQDEYYNYTEIGDVDVGSGDISWTNRKGEDLPANAKIPVTGGELIISKVRPTRGAIAIIPDGFEGICSGAFVVGKIDSPLREVVQLFLRSEYGKILLGRPQKGSSYPTITDEDVLNINVPILETGKTTKISDLVQKSHKFRRESKRLLEVAKRAIEIAIEESEEKAIQYLYENQVGDS